MGLTSIPTEVDNSLGRDKQNIDAPENYAIQPVAGEYNVLKHAIKGLCDSVGLGDGTTQGSLEQLARAVNDPAGARPDDFVLIDDFYLLDTDRWTEREIATGDASICVGNSGDGSDHGAGLLLLNCSAVNDEAGVIETNKFINGGHSPRITTYLKTPGGASDELTFGLVDTWPSPTYYAYFRNSSGAWSIYSKSANSDSDTGLGTCAINTYYKLSIEIDDDSEARFYVDDVLIGTLDGTDAIPTASNELGCFVNVKQAGSPLWCYIDYIDLRMSRL